MTRRIIFPTAVWIALCVGVLAQPEQIDALRGEIAVLRTLLEEQGRAFEAQRAALELKIASLETQVGEEARDSLQRELEEQLQQIVTQKSKFYRRPLGGRMDASRNVSVFDALEGGLIFTGLFRSRFEYRANNVDFRDDLDDRGLRFNGRFRLGFGAVLVDGHNTEPEISALTEFQAVGTLANNTVFSVVGPGGVPLPTEFNIFKEPFEDVGIYQGYLAFDRLLGSNLYLKVGRQELVFGNEFILGNNSFYDGTVHDGVVATWDKGAFALSGFFLRQAQSDNSLAVFPPGSDFDEDWLSGLYATWDPSSRGNAAIEAYALFFDARSNGFDNFVTRTTAQAFDGTLNSAIQGQFWTLGGRLYWTQVPFLGGLLQINAEAALQIGSNRLDLGTPGDILDQRIRGLSGELLLNWALPSKDNGLHPILSLGYYYAQGGSPAESVGPGRLDRIGFQPLFINRHLDSKALDRVSFLDPYHAGGGRYGNMDLVPLNNIHVFKAALTVAPVAEVEVGVSGLLAIVADDEGYGTGVFGWEVDVFAKYEYSPWVQFSANLSVFLPQGAARDASDFYFFSDALGPGGEPAENPGGAAALAFYFQALISF